MKDKQKLIEILEGLGFSVEYDQFHIKNKGWIRCRHKDDINHLSTLTLIVYSTESLKEILADASRILIKIGQWKKIHQLTTYI